MGTLFRQTPNNGYPFPPKWPLKMGTGLEASAAHPRPNNIWVPPPPPPRAKYLIFRCVSRFLAASLHSYNFCIEYIYIYRVNETLCTFTIYHDGHPTLLSIYRWQAMTHLASKSKQCFCSVCLILQSYNQTILFSYNECFFLHACVISCVSQMHP